MALINVDVRDVDASSGGFEPIPAGHYPAQVTDSEVKQTKKGNGSYLSLEFTVIGEKYANRKIWLNLNTDNPNPKAVGIAKGQLAAICDCIGHPGLVNDSQELHMKPMIIDVVIKRDEQYGDKNEIRGFSNINGDVSSKGVAPQPAPPAAPQPPQSAPPVAGNFAPPGMK